MPHSKSDLERELKERLRFETLLTEISANFVNLPADRIDGAIEDAQRRVCECLGLDLSSLWQWDAQSPRRMTITHFFSPPEGPSRPESIDAREAFPWMFQKMLDGEALKISTEALPPQAERDRESRRRYGIKSSVVIPLATGGGPLIGILSFNIFMYAASRGF